MAMRGAEIGPLRFEPDISSRQFSARARAVSKRHGTPPETLTTCRVRCAQPILVQPGELMR
jgi:hypothetical protein